MIDEIQVQNLALIRSASLAPSRGLTVLTGETGAGKTALLSALKLLMGARASADMVRDGESALTVSGRFFGLDEDDTVVSRSVGLDGRSRANVDGQMASMRELAALVGPSIDLCGQFEHQQLMRTSTHVALLDAWASESVDEARADYAAAWAAAQDAARALAQVREAGETSSAKLDEARFTLRRIDEVAPQDGEYELLKQDLERAEHAEALSNAASGAHEALTSDTGALDALNAAASALEAAGRLDDELASLARSLRDAGYIIEDVAAQVRDYRERVDFDPETLAEQQMRFSQLQGLMRSFGPRIEDVLEKRAQAAELVALVDDSEIRLRDATRALAEAEDVLLQAADRLDAAREAAAPEFSKAVSDVMTRLEMPGAQLVCSQRRLAREEWTRTGPSAFEFLYRPGAGMQARPLQRIASGGEVSRVMLAVKVVLGADDAVDTLVFDEVDAGIGGAVAVALADVIADLARTHQVLVITHLAQVAVKGDTHYVVSRAETENGPETHLSLVTGEDREREIARMLSGSATSASLAHARELLSNASNA